MSFIPLGTAYQSKKNLARLKEATARGAFPVCKTCGQPDLTNSSSETAQTENRESKIFADRKEQEAKFGLKRGKNAGYSGD